MQPLRFILLTFILTISPFFALGQTKADTVNLVSKWEVGLDLLGLFNENNVPKSSIFFRRNYAIANNKCKALRFRIGLDSEKRDGYKYDGLLLGEYMTYAPYLSVGHEWKKVFKSYRWYIGCDAFGSYTHSNQYYLYSGDDKYENLKIRNVELGMSGLMGFQINLLKYLSLGIESALLVQYSEQHSDSINNTQTAIGGEDDSKLTTTIKPFMAINLIYSLQNNKKHVKK
jgi:hypothetical protein